MIVPDAKVTITATDEDGNVVETRSVSATFDLSDIETRIAQLEVDHSLDMARCELPARNAAAIDGEITRLKERITKLEAVMHTAAKHCETALCCTCEYTGAEIVKITRDMLLAALG